MLGGGWGVSRSAPPSLEAMSACSGPHPTPSIIRFSVHIRQLLARLRRAMGHKHSKEKLDGEVSSVKQN